MKFAFKEGDGKQEESLFLELHPGSYYAVVPIIMKGTHPDHFLFGLGEDSKVVYHWVSKDSWRRPQMEKKRKKKGILQYVL